MQQSEPAREKNNRRPRANQPTAKAEPAVKTDPKPVAINSRSRIYRQPCRERLHDGSLHVYLFEVHDFLDKKTYGDRFWGHIRDITSQSAIEVPLSMIKPLIQHLMTCQSNEAELEHDEDDENEEEPLVPRPSQVTVFDLEQLKNHQFRGLGDTFVLEISDKKITCEPLVAIEGEAPAAAAQVPESDGDARRDILKPRSKSGSIVITEWLLPRLILVLRDIYMRHLEFPNGPPDVRNLYAPSGSRRFYFDIHETMWGARLQISQVTSQHRNTISIPMESLVLFRNRLNKMIDRIGLDQFTELRVARSPREEAPAAAARKNNRVRAGGKPQRPFRRPLSNRYFTPLAGKGK